MTAPPASLPLNWGAIAQELRERRQWVGWRLRQRPGRAKPTKEPLSPRDGSLASTTDPVTWGTFEQARECPGADGIGFVFAVDDPYVGIDLDSCRDPATGVLDGTARDIVRRLASYTEVSPSGAGIHVIVRGSLPGARRRKGSVEMYSEARYFTMTGHLLDGAPTEIAERVAELAELHREVFDEPEQKPPAEESPSPIHLNLTDEQVIDRASEAANGAKFRALWSGDVHGYPSASEADLALCSILAYWTGGDAGAVDRLFRRSALHRGKWDEPRGAQTYGALTVTRALRGLTAKVTGAALPHGSKGFALTDYGNAERLVARHGHDLHYVPALKQWLVWDGTRWRADGTGAVVRRAKHTVRGIYEEAAAEEDEAQRRKIARWSQQSESETRLKAMIALAQSEPEVALALDEFDADHWVLNVRNGTVDLRTGLLRPHRREDLIAKLAPVVYDPEARSERWEAFLQRVLPDPEVRAFQQRAVGYSLTGAPDEDVLFFVHGPTRAGKSTFLEAIRAAAGEYATVADFEAFVKRRGAGGPRNDIARLAGARLVVSIEVEDGQQLATALVKGLTGGDRIAARFLYKEAFEFAPQFTLWIAANHRPRIPDDDAAMWARVREVPFTVTIPPEERDPGLKRELADPTTSGAAVLAWAVRGCLEWQRTGLRAPRGVEAATEQYRSEMDPLSPFLADCCVLRDEAWTSSADLRAEYERHCRERGEEPIGGRAFTERLKARGLVPRRRGHSNTRGWLGVGLLSTLEEAGATAATVAIGSDDKPPLRDENEEKLRKQPVAGGRTDNFESVAAKRSGRTDTEGTAATGCRNGCGAPPANPGEICDACSDEAMLGRGDGAE